MVPEPETVEQKLAGRLEAGICVWTGVLHGQGEEEDGGKDTEPATPAHRTYKDLLTNLPDAHAIKFGEDSSKYDLFGKLWALLGTEMADFRWQCHMPYCYCAILLQPRFLLCSCLRDH